MLSAEIAGRKQVAGESLVGEGFALSIAAHHDNSTKFPFRADANRRWRAAKSRIAPRAEKTSAAWRSRSQSQAVKSIAVALSGKPSILRANRALAKAFRPPEEARWFGSGHQRRNVRTV
jgi:hypothetical protein